MSGTPTEAELQAQWVAFVDVLETNRALFDGTIAANSGKLDTLIQASEGTYTPSAIASFADQQRALMSDLVSASEFQRMFAAILFEYGRLMEEEGGAYLQQGDLFRALYERFVANADTVETRAITFDTSATTSGLGSAGAIIGNGTCSRLTKDENDFNLEACHVEKKRLRCRSDENSGARKNAEVFEIMGEAASPDSLLRGSFGSGDANRTAITSKHAGSGDGGSLLTNSSFTTYNSANTPKFSGWTESAGGASVSQDTTNYYRTDPSTSTGSDASLKITGGSGTVTLKQSLTSMRTRRISPERPYFFRVMVNPTIGLASGGTFTIRLGSFAVDTLISAMSSGWQEILIPIGQYCWPRNFLEEDFDVEIEWASSTSGFLLVDDVLFTDWTLHDGTWWLLRGNAASHTPWHLDDVLEFEDTGGAPGTGKLQWWLFQGGYGHLPSSGTPTITDP